MFNNRLNHYKRRAKITQANIWDLEFLRFQLQQQREGCRIEFDRFKEQIDACDQKTAQEKLKPAPDQSVIDSLAKLKERTTLDTEQLLAQMTSIDQQIEGDQGINSKIDGAHSLQSMLQAYIKR